AIDRINSVGVRYWMDFVKAREKAGVSLTFERCSPVMVGQITMITHFMGARSRVKSLLAPYSCTGCKSESDVVVEAAPGAQVQATLPCPKCGARMELDDLVESYADALARVTP